MILPTLGELGRHPLALQILGRIITYWIHILESKENSYLHSLYQEMYERDGENRWIILVKYVLNKVGMKHVWNNQSTLNVKRLRYAVNNKLENLYEMYWNKQKECTPKLEYYNQVTDKYGLQPYLTLQMNKKYVTAMSKLRISAHELMIERGRYTNVKRQDRLCTHCKDVEDELHFLDKCSLYKKPRDNLLKHCTPTRNVDKDNSISELIVQKQYQKEIAKYIFEAFAIRSSKVSTS